MKSIRFITVAALMAVLVLPGIALPVQGVKEVELDYGGAPYEVNRDSQGRIYVSDAGAQKIWQINPSNGTYKYYPIGRSVRDAQMDSDGYIWWTDGANSFGYVLSGSPLVYNWTLTADPPYTLQALAPDEQGGVWLGEAAAGGSDMTASRLFHFDTRDNTLCTYNLAYGAYTHGMIFHDGYLWLGQWVYGQVYRISPGNGSITYTYWQEEYTEGFGPWDIAVEGSYVWWADYFANSIARLDTSNNMATFFSLPVGDSPRMVTLNNGNIWFTEENNNVVGMLRPQSASGEVTDLSVYSDDPVGGDCTNLGSATTGTFTINYGDFLLSDSAADVTYDQDGWQFYQLPGDALPYGITGTAGNVWVGDQGRHLLLRFDVQSVIYIPFIHKK